MRGGLLGSTAAMTTPEDRLDITADLVASLITGQFPRWAHLRLERVEPGGWDNTTFRLGEDLLVRLPTAARYASQVAKEHTWLPRLRARLPCQIPVPLAMGSPSRDYRWNWSIYRWLPGCAVTAPAFESDSRLAAAVGGFLTALHRIPAQDGPQPGDHNFFRGGSLEHYDEETRAILPVVSHRIDAERALHLWTRALDTRWSAPPVWVHGDLSPSNLLATNGQLSAVIDFGCCGIGDPACDLTLAWTLFSAESRAAFQRSIAVDEGAWLRARAWCLWKNLIALAEVTCPPADAALRERIVAHLIAEAKA